MYFVREAGVIRGCVSPEEVVAEDALIGWGGAIVQPNVNRFSSQICLKQINKKYWSSTWLTLQTLTQQYSFS